MEIEFPSKMQQNHPSPPVHMIRCWSPQWDNLHGTSPISDKAHLIYSLVQEKYYELHTDRQWRQFSNNPVSSDEDLAGPWSTVLYENKSDSSFDCMHSLVPAALYKRIIMSCTPTDCEDSTPILPSLLTRIRALIYCPLWKLVRLLIWLYTFARSCRQSKTVFRIPFMLFKSIYIYI